MLPKVAMCYASRAKICNSSLTAKVLRINLNFVAGFVARNAFFARRGTEFFSNVEPQASRHAKVKCLAQPQSVCLEGTGRTQGEEAFGQTCGQVEARKGQQPVEPKGEVGEKNINVMRALGHGTHWE